MTARRKGSTTRRTGWTLSALLCGAAIGAPTSPQDQPFWGCGLVGPLPGIDGTGNARGDGVRTLIDGLKATNRKYGGAKVTYWNWNFAPEGGLRQHLTADFVFLPTNWGIGPIPSNDQCGGNECLHRAGEVPFLDGDGRPCPATMGDILLGANEPDIYGSCMGEGAMGRCTGPCTPEEVEGGDCPVAHLTGNVGAAGDAAEAAANSNGRCDCWTDSHATGVGFWNIPDIHSVYQPLPTCWDRPDCVDYVMDNWKKVAAKAVERGYRYLSAPMVAVSMDWMRNFVSHTCADGCTDMSCGCPTHVSWHYYANGCQPEAEGGYAEFQRRLDATAKLMEDFPHLLGAIVNEVGMLNCAMDTPDAICVPNGPGQKYPANEQPDHACPSTPDLPDGLASFVERILGMVGSSRTADGRLAVVGFTWFNMNMDGGTYNLSLFDDDESGNLNALGRQYVESCRAWADGTAPPPPHAQGGGRPAAAPSAPRGGDGGTDGAALTTALVALSSSLLCFCCGAYFGVRYATSRGPTPSGGSIVASLREQKERGRYEMAGANCSALGAEDDEGEEVMRKEEASFDAKFGLSAKNSANSQR